MQYAAYKNIAKNTPATFGQPTTTFERQLSAFVNRYALAFEALARAGQPFGGRVF